jgi:hypothetical protein
MKKIQKGNGYEWVTDKPIDISKCKDCPHFRKGMTVECKLSEMFYPVIPENLKKTEIPKGCPNQ